jgi:DNA mismatch repair protein MutL
LLQLVESGSDSDADQQAGVLCQWLVEQGISAEKIYDFATATRLLTELVADFSDQLADVRMVRPLPLANVLAEFADGN